MVKIAIRKKPDVKLVCFLQIAERGTQDFSTRLIKHTELGEKARLYHLHWSKSVLKYTKVAKVIIILHLLSYVEGGFQRVVRKILNLKWMKYIQHQ